MATVIKEEKRWVGEVDTGHPRRDLVNQGRNSGDPQPLYEVDIFNPAFPDEEVETRRDEVTSPKEGLNMETNPGLPVPKLNPNAPNYLTVGVPSRGGPGVTRQVHGPPRGHRPQSNPHEQLSKVRPPPESRRPKPSAVWRSATVVAVAAAAALTGKGGPV